MKLTIHLEYLVIEEPRTTTQTYSVYILISMFSSLLSPDDSFRINNHQRLIMMSLITSILNFDTRSLFTLRDFDSQIETIRFGESLYICLIIITSRLHRSKQ